MQYENELENLTSNSFSVKFFIIIVILSYADTLADYDEFNEWLEEWKEIEPDEKLAHMEELFRTVLSDKLPTYYYSFCNDDINYLNFISGTRVFRENLIFYLKLRSIDCLQII